MCVFANIPAREILLMMGQTKKKILFKKQAANIKN